MIWLLALVLVIPLGLDLYMPVPETNPMTVEKIEQGRRLFTDRRLSSDRTVACASCHDPRRAFADGRPVAIGVHGQLGRRSAPALINRGYGRAFFWDGRATTLEEQVVLPIQDPNEMNLPLAEASARVGMSTEDLSRALASYVRSILSGGSPFDQFINGDRIALTTEQQTGLRLFFGKGNCPACHIGPNFSDERFHNTGIAWRDGHLHDEGRAGVTLNEADRGAFKTPTLREIARTAPYMHDGSLSSLDEVIDYYDRGGNINPGLDRELHPLRLTAAEKHALASFLRSLTGSITEGPGKQL